MVSCVTFEVLIITEPVRFYRCDRVYLVNYIKNKDERNAKSRESLYRDVFDEVVKRIREENPGIEVVCIDEHPTYDFMHMMRTVFDILQTERKEEAEVMVNISGGTGEFSAAATVASMMHDGVTLFSVGVPADKRLMTFDQMRENMTHEGRLVGRGFGTTEPFRIPCFSMEPPDRRLLLGLKVLDLTPVRRRSNTEVIRRLVACGLWTPHDDSDENTIVVLEENGRRRPEVEEKEYRRVRNSNAVYYQRNFILKWKERGWIAKEGTKYIVTGEGRNYLDAFYRTDMEELEKREWT